jgi:ubiquinone/menaquinone biosynthesis C-methylase UbiE
MLEKLKHYLQGKRPDDLLPADAYNLWSQDYDDQPDNLMLALDEEMFTRLIKPVPLKDKNIIDVGCGTGRHWNKILEQQPKSLTGYDVSEGMLDMLKIKYPQAVTYKLNGNHLTMSENGHSDVVISTLTIAHIENLEEAFYEWQRVLTYNGEVIITDFHPEMLASGGRRTFFHNGQTYSVKNYIHSIEKILRIAGQLDWELVNLEERKIDDSMKSYYEKKNAVPVFEKFKGMPVIFGMHLMNKHVVA